MSEEVINLTYLAEAQPSLCIPRVFNNITEARIYQVFDKLGLGKISRLDIKERQNKKGETFKRVYVHFDKWFLNEDAQAARRKLVSGKEIRIVYDNPWFWKVSANKWAPTGDSQDKRAPQHTISPHQSQSEDHRNRLTDEFGRDLTMRNNYEESHRCDDLREHRSPEKRNVRTTERRDDSQERRRADTNRYETMHDRRNAKLPIAPTLTLKSEPRDDRRNAKLPIAPTLTLKTKKQEHIVLPRQRVNNPNFITPNKSFNLDYGNILPPPKRKMLPVKKPTAEPAKELKDGEIVEDGEIVKKQTIFTAGGLSKEDRDICELLYGDLV